MYCNMIWNTLYFLCVSFKQLYKHIGKNHFIPTLFPTSPGKTRIWKGIGKEN